MNIKLTLRQLFCNHIMALSKKKYLYSVVISIPYTDEMYESYAVYADYMHCLKCEKTEITERRVKIGKFRPTSDFR